MNSEDQEKEKSEPSADNNLPLQIFNTLGLIGEHLSEFKSQLESTIENVIKLIQNNDWQEIEISWRKAAESLGRKGWTLPLLMDVSDNIELSQISDTKKLNELIVKFHSIDNEFKVMKRDILDHKLIKQWKKLLEQCFENYEKENYLIVIPSLFIVIESLTQVLISPRYQKYINPNKDRKPSIRVQYNVVKQEIENDRTYIIIYVSVLEFLRSVFKAGNFDSNPNRLPIINRDWVLHGRDYPNNWTQVDALRLFNAIHTIIQLDFLLEDIEIDEDDKELVK